MAKFAEEQVEAATTTDDDDADDGDVVTLHRLPSTVEVYSALDTLRNALYAANTDGRFHCQVPSNEGLLASTAASRTEQTTPDRFFS